MSVENLKVCMDVFATYMQNRFDFDLAGSKTPPKKVLYELMTNVHEKYVNVDKVTLKDMNNIVLNSARDFYVKTYTLAESTAKQMLPLTVRPEPAQKMPLERDIKDFKALEEERNAFLVKPPASMADVQNPVTENAFETAEFDKRLADLRSMREDVNVNNNARMEQDMAARQSIETFHPKAFYEDMERETSKQKEIRDEVKPHVQRQDFVVCPTDKLYTVERYMSINGFDRDWFKHKNRFQIVADFSSYAENDLQNRYRNITGMTIKRVIIPQEIIEETGAGYRTRSVYNFPLSFTFPYVLITIDEIGDMYDGTNDHVRRCFCKMIVDKQYNAKNGRGFVVLQTMQDEKKSFYPTPLSRLSRLTISVRKPNGDLFNSSKDDYVVSKFEYEDFNPGLIKVVLNKYFDKNDFFIGDTIKMQNSMVTNARLREFLVRLNGHDIVEMGPPNENGYFKTFFINAPGDFDADSGVFVIDATACHCLLDEDADGDDGAAAADIMNMTLQCVVALKIEHQAADPGIAPLTV